MNLELDELLKNHDNPTTFAGEILSDIVALIPRYDVRALLSELPDRWRRALITWIVEAYDNSHATTEFIAICNPEHREQIDSARAWMRSNPGYRDDVVNDVTALVALTTDRIFSPEDLMHQLVRLSAERGTEIVLRELPAPWDQRFTHWARSHLDERDEGSQRNGERQVREWLRHGGPRRDP